MSMPIYRAYCFGQHCSRVDLEQAGGLTVPLARPRSFYHARQSWSPMTKGGLHLTILQRRLCPSLLFRAQMRISKDCQKFRRRDLLVYSLLFLSLACLLRLSLFGVIFGFLRHLELFGRIVVLLLLFGGAAFAPEPEDEDEEAEPA